MNKISLSGVVLLDKPEGLSSNTALQKVKRLYKAEKAGHAGTLDPMATGMLPICLDRATKISEYLLESDKCYQATIALGSQTDTGDKTGEVIAQSVIPALSKDCIEMVLAKFRGPINQVPPMYSALKHQGQRLYQLARKGREVERQSRVVTIYHLDVINFNETELNIVVECSKGTYIRVLGEDIAAALGTVGHLSALRRLYSAGFANQAMLSLEALQQSNELESHVISLEQVLCNWPSIEIGSQQLLHLYHGKSIDLPGSWHGRYTLICESKVVAIAHFDNGTLLSRKLI